MKAFFDTAVLVPLFDEDHVHHEPGIMCIAKYKQPDACGVHTLAEIYPTLARLPSKKRVRSQQAMLFLDSVRTLQSAAALSIIGGSIYDAMLARCALKSGAEIIYTWNTKYYAQCGAELVKRLSTP